MKFLDDILEKNILINTGDKDDEITICISGDFSPTKEVEKFFLKNESIDLFGYMNPFFVDSDISITNLKVSLQSNTDVFF